jgi:hypothetical protein
MRVGLVWRVGSSFLLDPNLNRSLNLKPHLQKVLPYRHPCHTWNLGLGTLCEVVKPPTSLLSMVKIALIDLKWLGTPCELDLGVSERKMDVKSTWIRTWRQMEITLHGHLDYFQKPPLGGRPNTKPGDHSTPKAPNCGFILFQHVWGPRMVRNSWK